MFDKIKNKIAMKRTPIEKIEDKELRKYLAKYNCRNCRNSCCLDSIRCGGGLQIREEKIREYNQNH